MGEAEPQTGFDAAEFFLLQADRQFALAEQCSPGNLPSRLVQATCALARGDAASASARLGEQPTRASPAWFNLRALSAQELGQLDQANHYFAQALAADPDYLPALYNSKNWARLLQLEPAGHWADREPAGHWADRARSSK